MRVLVFIAISLFSTFSSADYDDDPDANKTMIEVFDMVSSKITVTHKLFPIKVDGKEMTQTIGTGIHSLGVLAPTVEFRLYNCNVGKFPARIVRDDYDPNPPPVEIDQYLVFSEEFDIPKLPFTCP